MMAHRRYNKINLIYVLGATNLFYTRYIIYNIIFQNFKDKTINTVDTYINLVNLTKYLKTEH